MSKLAVLNVAPSEGVSGVVGGGIPTDDLRDAKNSLHSSQQLPEGIPQPHDAPQLQSGHLQFGLVQGSGWCVFGEDVSGEDVSIESEAQTPSSDFIPFSIVGVVSAAVSGGVDIEAALVLLLVVSDVVSEGQHLGKGVSIESKAPKPSSLDSTALSAVPVVSGRDIDGVTAASPNSSPTQLAGIADDSKVPKSPKPKPLSSDSPLGCGAGCEMGMLDSLELGVGSIASTAAKLPNSSSDIWEGGGQVWPYSPWRTVLKLKSGEGLA